MHTCYDVVITLFKASLTAIKLVLLYKILEEENFDELHEIRQKFGIKSESSLLKIMRP